MGPVLAWTHPVIGRCVNVPLDIMDSSVKWKEQCLVCITMLNCLVDLTVKVTRYNLHIFQKHLSILVNWLCSIYNSNVKAIGVTYPLN